MAYKGYKTSIKIKKLYPQYIKFNSLYNEIEYKYHRNNLNDNIDILKKQINLHFR